MRKSAVNVSDARLTERYCELFELGDWKSLPRQKIGELAFKIPQFWKDRAERLEIESVQELLDSAPLEGKHSLPGTPSYQRAQG